MEDGRDRRETKHVQYIIRYPRHSSAVASELALGFLDGVFNKHPYKPELELMRRCAGGEHAVQRQYFSRWSTTATLRDERGYDQNRY